MDNLFVDRYACVCGEIAVAHPVVINSADSPITLYQLFAGLIKIVGIDARGQIGGKLFLNDSRNLRISFSVFMGIMRS